MGLNLCLLFESSKVKIDKIFATPFIRAEKTVAFLASNNGIAITKYDSKDQNFAASLLEKGKDQTIVVVGHSTRVVVVVIVSIIDCLPTLLILILLLLWSGIFLTATLLIVIHIIVIKRKYKKRDTKEKKEKCTKNFFWFDL